MPDRREFVLRGVAAAVLAACPPAATGALAWLASSRAKPRQFFTVLFDRTGREGRTFGAEAARRGAPVRGVGRDPGTVWMQEIEPRARRVPTAIAGLTDGPSLFCMELLARDHGMRVVYRAHHWSTSDGRLHHAVTGPSPLLEWERRLDAAGSNWGVQAAVMAMTCPEEIAPHPYADLIDLAERPAAATRSLFSWVIAPVNQL